MANLENPITTQEELDKLIKDRISRAEEKVRDQYRDYEQIKADLAKLKGERDDATASHQKEIDALNGKISALTLENLRAKTAREYGIPYDFQDRLKGTTAEELEADAKTLAPMFQRGTAGQGGITFRANDPKPESDDPTRQALRGWLQDINKK